MNAKAGKPEAHEIDSIDLRGEERWLIVLAALTSVEFVWWLLCWRAGFAPAPQVGTYLGLAVASLLGALALRRFVRPGVERASLPVLLVATTFVGIGASLFLPLKYAIPNEMPFWLDVPLAAGERQLFGTDPWRIMDRLFGWALVPSDHVYALWLPVQSLALFSVIVLPPSPAKSRALIAYASAWFFLGVVAAMLLSSVGPIFYDRLLGGQRFAGLTDALGNRAWMVRAEADAMWASFASGRPSLVAGISAMPSIHVALSFWIWLTARSIVPRLAPIALAYAVFVWIASVQLGWHYFSDGLVGFLGMVAIWWLAGRRSLTGIARSSTAA